MMTKMMMKVAMMPMTNLWKKILSNQQNYFAYSNAKIHTNMTYYTPINSSLVVLSYSVQLAFDFHLWKLRFAIFVILK